MILLKGSVSPSALELPDVDLKVVIGDSWKITICYIIKYKMEGINVWEIH